MRKMLFNATVEHCKEVGATGRRVILDMSTWDGGSWLEQTATEHLAHDLDLIVALRHSGPNGDDVPLQPEDARALHASFQQPGVYELIEKGKLWIGLGNEVVNGAGRVDDDQWSWWVEVAERFYWALKSWVGAKNLRLVSPGIATGNVLLLTKQHEVASASEMQYDQLRDVLNMAAEFELTLDLHLHTADAMEMQYVTQMLLGFFGMTSEHPMKLPPIISTEWSFSDMQPRDPSLLPEEMRRGWELCRKLGYEAICPPYRPGAELAEKFKWCVLQGNWELIETYAELS